MLTIEWTDLNKGVLYNKQLIENICGHINIELLDRKVKGEFRQTFLVWFSNGAMQMEAWQGQEPQRQFILMLFLGIKPQHVVTNKELETNSLHSLGLNGDRSHLHMHTHTYTHIIIGYRGGGVLTV